MSLRAFAAAWLAAGTLMPAPILVHGHRGARAVRPENTMAAFEYAITAGVDVLELDLAVTKDNVLVASHDPVLNRKICRGPQGMSTVIRELTLDQVRQFDCGSIPNPDYRKQQPVAGARVPALDEVFALAGRGAFEFNIETKIFRDKPRYTPPPEVFALLVLEAIRRHRLESRVIVQSFDFRTLAAMKKLDARIRLAALIERPWQDFVKSAREAGATIISPQYRLVTREKVEAAHEAGLEVVAWTANEAKQWDALIAARVDAIISDDPAELIVYLKKRGLK